MVLAGGEGKRLLPLTNDRAKPAVPFGGNYRLIDFVLSNFANARYTRIVVLTQYKSHSLDLHITRTWRFSNLLGSYVTPVPAQMRRGPFWFSGSADAIYQNLNLINDEQPDVVCVFGADHIYRMDPRQMVADHIAHGGGVSVAAIPVPIEEAKAFGVIEADENQRILAFHEKSQTPPTMPGDDTRCLASMGNYVFDADVLVDSVTKDHDLEGSRHDMGGDIVPSFVAQSAGYVYDFKNNVVPGANERDRGYWRDVGTMDSYFDAHMDLVSIHPVFNLYNYEWPIYTSHSPYPPAKFVHGFQGRFGEALNSMVSPGVVISGAQVFNSVISPNVRVHSYANVMDSVVLDGCDIGRHANVRRAILDKNVVVAEGATVGVDHEHDRARGYDVTEAGITVVGKGKRVEQ